MAILTANQLSKVYGHKQKYRALNNISFSVEKGEFVAVMGPSGSGKTTLLNVLSSIDTCLLYTSPSPRDRTRSRMPSSA